MDPTQNPAPAGPPRQPEPRPVQPPAPSQPTDAPQPAPVRTDAPQQPSQPVQQPAVQSPVAAAPPQQPPVSAPVQDRVADPAPPDAPAANGAAGGPAVSQTQDHPAVGAVPPATPAGRRRFGRKAWLVVAAVVAIVAAVVVWQVIHARNEAAWNKATSYYEKAEYDKAADTLKGMGIPSDPKRLQIYSQTMLATKQLDKALEGYQKLYQVKNDSATKLVIGNIHNEQKKPDEAISTYKDIIASDPAYAQAYVNLASLYAMQGKTSEAIATIDQGIGKVPKSVTLHELKVSLLVSRKGSAEYNQAVAALRQVNPDDPLLRSLKE